MDAIENKNADEFQQDDEISLIDLLAVLIRYRKLVAGITLAVAVVAALVLFVLPSVRSRFFSAPTENAGENFATAKDVNASFTVRVNEFPVYLDEWISANFERSPLVTDFIFDVFSDVDAVASAHEKHPVWTVTEADASDYRNFAAGILSSNKLSLLDDSGKEVKRGSGRKNSGSSTVVGGGYVTRLTVSLSGIPESVVHGDASDFVQTLVSEAEARAQSVLIPLLEAIVEDGASGVAVRNAESFLSSFACFYALSATPATTPATTPAKTPLVFIVCCFAAFFLSVFIAFFLNAVENVKKDPVASGTIKNAWEAGKGKREKLPEER